jgi:CCR4-NOT transcription complex subunit 6
MYTRSPRKPSSAVALAAATRPNNSLPHHHQHPINQPQQQQSIPPQLTSVVAAPPSIPSSTHHYSSNKGRNNDKEQQQIDSEWFGLDLSNLSLRNLSPTLFTHFVFLKQLHLQGNSLTSISPNVVQLTNLEYLDLSGNALKTLPPVLGRMTWLRELLLYENYINVLPVELGFLYQLETFAVSGNPLIEPLYSMNQAQGGLAVLAFLRDNNTLPTPERQWLVLQQQQQQQPSSLDTCSFTIFSYNILSEKFATPRQYGFVPSWALEWEYRREGIANEIAQYAADIICLQEVDEATWESSIRLQMDEGWDGFFSAKSRSKTMPVEKERKAVDGCGTLWRKSRWRLEESTVLEFSQLGSKKMDIRKDEESFQRLLMKDNISLVTCLKDRETGRTFVVANVHIHWNPEFCDVKLVQTILLMEELEKILLRYPQAILLVCGDFNSTLASGVYRFLATGTVAPNDPDWAGFGWGRYSKEGARHSQRLKSLYTGQQANGMCTNITPWFRGHIDYIWYGVSGGGNASNGLVPTGLLAGLNEDYLGRIVGLPTQHCPSDHLSLMGEFKVLGKQ